MNPVAALAHLGVLTLQVSATLAHSRSKRHIPAHRAVGQCVPEFLERLQSLIRPKREVAIQQFLQQASHYGRPLIDGSTLYLFYSGRARRVSVPGDLNEWDPDKTVMTRVPGTNFHYCAIQLHRRARIEYRLAVDSTWILDPYNHQQAMGGSGPNSEVAMPGYRQPSELTWRASASNGTIDAMEFTSKLLNRSHPVFVYRPHGYDRSRRFYPSLYVLDGGDYLSLGMMATVLDNLIACRRIRPIIVVFVEPRTNVTRPATNKRTIDYTLSDVFVSSLTRELRQMIEGKYRVKPEEKDRAIMGASLGGLLATYAAYKHPRVFSLCAAQSPSYWWRNQSVTRMIADGPVRPVKFYLDTGTIQDSLDLTRAMRNVLQRKGYRYSYSEYHEGHNWGNWRARIASILEYFWGLP